MGQCAVCVTCSGRLSVQWDAAQQPVAATTAEQRLGRLMNSLLPGLDFGSRPKRAARDRRESSGGFANGHSARH